MCSWQETGKVLASASGAVKRRIKKVPPDLHEQGPLGANDQRNATKKNSTLLCILVEFHANNRVDRHVSILLAMNLEPCSIHSYHRCADSFPSGA